PFSSAMPERSTSVPGCARRSFIAPTRLCPPASALPPDLASAAAASATVFARVSSNAYMVGLPFRLLFRRLYRAPHTVGRGRHVEIRDARARERVVDGVHQGCGRADGARFAAALGAERIVRARRHLGADRKSVV